MSENMEISNRCDEILFLISQNLDGELLLEEEEALQNHLQVCSACSEEREYLLQIDAFTRRVARAWNRRDFSKERKWMDLRIPVSLSKSQSPRSSLPFLLDKFLPLCAAALILMACLSFNFFSPSESKSQTKIWVRSDGPIRLASNQEKKIWKIENHPVNMGVSEGALIEAPQKNEIQIGNKVILVLHKGAQIRILKGAAIKIEKGMVLVKGKDYKTTKIYTAGGQISLKKSSVLILVKKVSLSQFGQEVTQMTDVTALEGEVKLHNEHGNLTLAQGGKGLLNPFQSPQINFVLEEDSILLSEARRRWEKRKLLFSMHREADHMKKIFENTRWSKVSFYGSSPKEFVDAVNNSLMNGPYLLLLSQLPKKALSFQSETTKRLPQIIQWLEGKVPLFHIFTPELILLGKPEDLKRFVGKNFPQLLEDEKIPTLGNLGDQKIKLHLRDYPFARIPALLYKQKKIKLYFSEEVLKNSPSRHTYEGLEISLRDYLSRLRETLGAEWEFCTRSSDTLFLFRPSSLQGIEKIRRDLQTEMESFSLKILGKIRTGGRVKIALQTRWGRGIYGQGEEIKKIRILKIEDSRVIFVYKGLLFSYDMG